jgi:hypothetical protein
VAAISDDQIRQGIDGDRRGSTRSWPQRSEMLPRMLAYGATTVLIAAGVGYGVGYVLGGTSIGFVDAVFFGIIAGAATIIFALVRLW